MLWLVRCFSILKHGFGTEYGVRLREIEQGIDVVHAPLPSATVYSPHPMRGTWPSVQFLTSKASAVLKVIFGT